MAIALSKGETFVLAKKNTTTYIKSSTDYVEQALVVRNNIYVTGSAAAGTKISNTGHIELTNLNNNTDPYIVFKPSTVALQNFVLGYDDSENRFALGTGNSLATGAENRTVFHVPSGSRILHVDEGLVVTGSAYISNGLQVTGSAYISSNITATNNISTVGYITGSRIRSTGHLHATQIFVNTNAQYSIGGTIQSVGVNGQLFAFVLNQNSDKRIKQDILPIENALNKILMLNGVTYNWNKEFDPDLNLDDNKHIGLLAQDVEKIIPLVVHTDNSKHQLKSMTYIELIPVLIEAIKEQQTQINELKNKLKDTPYG